MDPIERIIEKVKEVAASLGYPVDHNRPFDLNHDEFPRVSVWDGEEETVEQEGAYESWGEEVSISPVIEVLVEDDDPDVTKELVKDAWKQLRSEIASTDWRPLTVSGKPPSYRKGGLEVEDKPGIGGFAVEINFRVYTE